MRAAYTNGMGLSRRAFLEYAVLQFLLARRLLAAPAMNWVRELETMCRDLGRRTLTPVEWQDAIVRLFAKIDHAELVKAIDFEKLVADIKLPPDRAETKRFRLPGIEGERSFGTQIFALGKGRAIVPHGHRNMVSMHYVLAGNFHVRHFDRGEAEDGRFVLRPTIDKQFAPGAASTISDQRDNVHWFVCESERGYTLDVVVDSLEKGRARYEILYLDPDRAEKRADGTLLARRINIEDAFRRYGHTK
jgi:hypothetical protein